ncbi:MAG TPA: TIGR01212 family radical SAM protein [Acidobacteriota bacterium]|nr:TIGR01212 family radical SAM protein [Acidobacteriota bacterium]HNT17985.1 TIGR01212 family radical SAM protein [Acidobacteriota bacterium]HPA26608.1 TIGR01212 family radical SAM protein [Acidobacteriota bacterium]HQO19458.1 TIGR01212 family radical SAM protein [Acidobacteriota bacterium]HQQ46010.1 TIGR01212 family radical SAM protein [Acidobacteriota bacterium]
MTGFDPSPDAPINTLSGFFRDHFGGRVRKVSLDAGFSCPNREGADRRGGCHWCDPSGSGPAKSESGWEEVLRAGAAKLSGKGFKGAIAYFQAFTNTLGGTSRLEEVYEKALSVEGVLGLAVGTRPDCLSMETMEILERLNRKTFLWVEIGMQTMHDPTLALCNRGHGHAATVSAFGELHRRGMRTVLHLIAGLPGETGDMIRESFEEAARLDPWGIKLHPLHVVRGSEFEKWHTQGKLRVLGLSEYAELAVRLIEVAAPRTVFHRITGERPEGMLVAPAWCLEKDRVRNEIYRLLHETGGFQGRLNRKN